MANNITIRDAKIIFKNFAGKAKQFNPEGRRNFSLLIEDADFAERLLNDGWNVKPLKKSDENDDQHWHLAVNVDFGYRPPMITMVSGNMKTMLDETTVNMIDWADIIKIDLTIRPREYHIPGRDGIKAYLKTMFVTIEEDELAADYADIGENHFDEDLPF